MSPTREKFPLSKKKVLKKTIGATIGWMVLLGLLSLAFCGISFALMESAGTGLFFVTLIGSLVLMVLIAVANYFYQLWYFATYYYEFSNDYVVIRKSPLAPKEITIPYERIQDVYVDQDLFDRMLGLYDVHLSTATISSGMEAHIDGVEKASADGLRDFLLKKVQERVGRKTAV